MAKTSRKSAKTKPKTVPKAEVAQAQPLQAERSAPHPVEAKKRVKGDTLPGFLTLFIQALRLFGRHWKLFVGITLLYGLLNILLVHSFGAAGNLSEAKAALDNLFTGSWGQLVAGAGLFVYLLGASGNTASATAGIYQTILTLVFSLALIWTLRQLYAGHKVGVKDGLYKGLTPLIPFILVLMVVGLQLLPLAIGATIYGAVAANGIAVTAVEQILWAVLFFVAAMISFYLVASSLFGLYIVTLPDMTPMKALRSARQLVYGRRFAVLRRVIMLPVALVILAGLLIIPLILFATPLAAWAFFAISMLLLPLIHSYMYGLYRSLL